ncbi:hypothetical protein ANCDUO_03898 [Ancylostoma duodenale]|uniref:Uncharacterized protein n=1 Tax=Ancylostoma duodenale TaxID=51022 RepID=A0A0C2DSN6_9BILA|nr:hypothetical protein ANCDUO_03898 [Ancylostoma duodenale]
MVSTPASRTATTPQMPRWRRFKSALLQNPTAQSAMSTATAMPISWPRGVLDSRVLHPGLQATKLQFCLQCLNPVHQDNCEVRCGNCGSPQFTALPSQKASASAQASKF